VSELLTRFLREWLEWAEGGAPENEIFTRRVGLCSSFSSWMRSKLVPYRDGEKQYIALCGLFIADGLDDSYPFNSPESYEVERNESATHLNPKRLAWVRSKVAQKEVV
jgi:hypothetical protein